MLDQHAAKVAARLDEHLQKYPHLAVRLNREFLIALDRRGVVSIDSIQDRAQTEAGLGGSGGSNDPNQAERDRWNERVRAIVESLTREYVSGSFSESDVDDLVNLTLKREQVHNLEDIANLPTVSFRQLAEKIQRFCELPLGETQLSPAEVAGTRVALVRHLLSDQLEFIGLAKQHLRIRDFDHISRRIVGTDNAMGRIGGKAGGMWLAYRILSEAEPSRAFLPLAMPESYYLRSDIIEDFLRLNRLHEYQNQKYKNIEDVSREYPLIKGMFRNGEFPLEIVQKLRRILNELGTHPLIVRSSSLLEDRIGTAFCGKYASVFIANQGTLEQRLHALLGAIGEVYASTLAPDPILYRREHNLIDYVEEMAVLIQKVVGVPFGDYFLPLFAGVAFSRNEYRWTPRIRREDGLMRVVMGLGTRAVDRSGTDYPRMVALSAPTLRPESTVQEIVRSAQRNLDVIDLKNNRLRSVRLSELLASGTSQFPMLDRMVSVYRDDELYAPMGQHVDAEPERMCITFDKLLRSTELADRVRGMLTRLEAAYGVPVDMEFACDGERFYILQCRTQSQAAASGPVQLPTGIPDADVVFEARKYVRTGLVERIEYIVYIDPSAYDAVPTRERRMAIGRVVGRINHQLRPRSFILIGPGRWGSNDIQLGVPVRYADINRSAMLIEVARLRGGFMPEVSFGTHFFQDLVEANIHYLPLYPDSPDIRYNEAFLRGAPNVLPSLVPDDADFADEIRVIHVPSAAGGRMLTACMDGETDRALAYLKPE